MQQCSVQDYNMTQNNRHELTCVRYEHSEGHSLVVCSLQPARVYSFDNDVLASVATMLPIPFWPMPLMRLTSLLARLQQRDSVLERRQNVGFNLANFVWIECSF